MAFKELNHGLNLDFIRGAADLKLHVFINLREQIRQKREGVCAC